MKKIAIDIDGTLTRYPDLVSVFSRAGHYVCLLTGALTRNKQDADIEYRRKQVAALGVDPSIDIHIMIGNTKAEVASLKGQFCAHNCIDVFIDDREDYCAAVRCWSPNTIILKVYG